MFCAAAAPIESCLQSPKGGASSPHTVPTALRSAFKPSVLDATPSLVARRSYINKISASLISGVRVVFCVFAEAKAEERPRTACRRRRLDAQGLRPGVNSASVRLPGELAATSPPPLICTRMMATLAEHDLALAEAEGNKEKEQVFGVLRLQEEKPADKCAAATVASKPPDGRWQAPIFALARKASETFSGSMHVLPKVVEQKTSALADEWGAKGKPASLNACCTYHWKYYYCSHCYN